MRQEMIRAWLSAMSFFALIAVAALTLGTPEYGRITAQALMLEQWYKPFQDASPATMDRIYEAAFAIAALGLAVGLFIYVVDLAARGKSGQLAEELFEIAAEAMMLTFHPRRLARAAEKAKESLASTDETEAGRRFVEASGIDTAALPGLVDAQADRLAKAGRTEDDAHEIYLRLHRQALAEALASADRGYILASMRVEAGQSVEAWMRGRGIFHDRGHREVLIPSQSIEARLVPHTLGLLLAAERFVESVGAKTPAQVVEARAAFDSAAEVLAAAREFYPDDDIPESVADITRWALAQVEEARHAADA